MISLLAKQSVERKMVFKASKLLGPYEFYYSAGLLYGRLGIERPSKLPAAKDMKSAVAACGAPEGKGYAYLYNSFVSFADRDEAPGDEGTLMQLFSDGYMDAQEEKQ